MSQKIKDAVREAEPREGCLARIGRKQCKKRCIKGHTVQRAQLAAIARTGKVYSAGEINVIGKGGSTVPPWKRKAQEVNVRRASVRRMTCAEHDQALFRPIETGTYQGGSREIQAILLRGAMIELQAKQFMVNIGKQTLREMHGIPTAGLKGLLELQLEVGEKQKKRLRQEVAVNSDMTADNKARPAMISLQIRMEGRSPVLGHGMFYPEYIRGILVQDMSRRLVTTRGAVAWYAGNDAEGGWLCLATRAENDGKEEIGELLLEELAEVDVKEGAAKMVTMGFLRIENMFMKPSWWDELPEKTRKKAWELALTSTMQAEYYEPALPEMNWGPHITARESKLVRHVAKSAKGRKA